jgi:hypothetical protein
MGSLAFWLLTGGERATYSARGGTQLRRKELTAANRMNAGASMRIALMWEVLSFTIPAAFMAALFLYDAVRNERSDDEIFDSVVPQSFSRQNNIASAPNMIILSQNVSVVEEYPMDSKAESSENEKINKLYRYR